MFWKGRFQLKDMNGKKIFLTSDSVFIYSLFYSKKAFMSQQEILNTNYDISDDHKGNSQIYTIYYVCILLTI